jgi:hypothetical protein
MPPSSKSNYLKEAYHMFVSLNDRVAVRENVTFHHPSTTPPPECLEYMISTPLRNSRLLIEFSYKPLTPVVLKQNKRL